MYGTKGGEDTLDTIFLLSVEEAVCSYAEPPLDELLPNQMAIINIEFLN